MKQIPILFNTPMVAAILDGRKTMTRRIIKSRHESDLLQVCRRKSDNEITSINSLDWDERNCEKDIIPKWKVGDALWVRETFMYSDLMATPYWYKADLIQDLTKEAFERMNGHWKPSIFMPKEACRIFLKIVSVKVERLQEISEADAKAEGVDKNCTEDVLQCSVQKCRSLGCQCNDEYFNYGAGFDDFPCFSAIDSFKSLWQKINGRESWDANPFVWVIEFERLQINNP